MIRDEVYRYGPVTVKVRVDKEVSMSEISRAVYGASSLIEANEYSVRDEAVEVAEKRIRAAIENLLKEKRRELARLSDADHLSESDFERRMDLIYEYVDGVRELADALQIEYDGKGWT